MRVGAAAQQEGSLRFLAEPQRGLSPREPPRGPVWLELTHQGSRSCQKRKRKDALPRVITTYTSADFPHVLLATFAQDEHSPKGSKEFFFNQSQFSSGIVVKNPPANARNSCKRCRFDPRMGKMPWRRKWHSTPEFLLGKFHGHSP